jgi:hypothetical protein
MSCLSEWMSNTTPTDKILCPICGEATTERKLSELTPSELRLLLREEFELSKTKKA